MNSQLLPMTTSLFKNFFFKFSDIRYKSANNLFFDTFEETKSYQFSDYKEIVDLRGDSTLIKGTFNQITFIMSDESKIIARHYDKLSSSFGTIGGVSHALILISKLILYFWSNNNTLILFIIQDYPKSRKR